MEEVEYAEPLDSVGLARHACLSGFQVQVGIDIPFFYIPEVLRDQDLDRDALSEHRKHQFAPFLIFPLFLGYGVPSCIHLRLLHDERGEGRLLLGIRLRVLRRRGQLLGILLVLVLRVRTGKVRGHIAPASPPHALLHPLTPIQLGVWYERSILLRLLKPLLLIELFIQVLAERHVDCDRPLRAVTTKLRKRRPEQCPPAPVRGHLEPERARLSHSQENGTCPETDGGQPCSTKGTNAIQAPPSPPDTGPCVSC